MKILLIFASCFVLGIRSDRVKRIVGGEKAAIPKPISNLVQNVENTEQSSSSGSVLPGRINSATGSSKGTAATSPSPDYDNQDYVSIYEEDRSSKILGVKEKDGYISFKGIRYAKPPLGHNRFQVRLDSKILNGKCGILYLEIIVLFFSYIRDLYSHI